MMRITKKVKSYKWVLVVEILDTKRKYKFKVDPTVKIKEIANRMSHEMKLDPITTEWVFFTSDTHRHELLLSKTMR